MILGGGCRGRELAAWLVQQRHAVRISTRTESARAAIERAGAECWIGTPDRLATLRGSLDGVAIACWLLGTADGSAEELAALHSTRLELFLTQTVDTTVRGFLFESRGTTTPASQLLEGEAIARRLCAANAIPLSVLTADPRDGATWQRAAREALGELLGG
jgi:hypothetical protein